MHAGLAAVLFALTVAQAPARAQQPTESPSVRMVRGHVVAVDPSRRTFLLKHEEIPSLGMAEMEMQYVAPEGAALPAVAAGDRVRFAVVRLDGRYVITRVEPLPPARASALRQGRPAAARSDP